MSKRRLLTKKELSDLLHVSERTIDRYRNLGIDLGTVKMGVGGTVRFDPVKVQEAIDQGRFTRGKRNRR